MAMRWNTEMAVGCRVVQARLLRWLPDSAFDRGVIPRARIALVILPR
jgi:hypothetical protein